LTAEILEIDPEKKNMVIVILSSGNDQRCDDLFRLTGFGHVDFVTCPDSFCFVRP
jgi:hypothetical protein